MDSRGGRQAAVILCREMRPILDLLMAAAETISREGSAAERDRALASLTSMRALIESTRAIVEAVGPWLPQHDTAHFHPAPVLRGFADSLRRSGVAVSLEIDDKADGKLACGSSPVLEALLVLLLWDPALHDAFRPGPLRLELVAAERAVRVVLVSSDDLATHGELGISTYLCWRMVDRLGATLTTTSTATEHRAEVELKLRDAMPSSNGTGSLPSTDGWGYGAGA